jgi:uncharacterized protein YqkB
MQLFFEKRKVLFTKIMSKERNIHQKVVTLRSKRNYWFSPTLIIIERVDTERRWECSENLQHYPVL